jgi:hypothetical protein
MNSAKDHDHSFGKAVKKISQFNVNLKTILILLLPKKITEFLGISLMNSNPLEVEFCFYGVYCKYN